MTATKMEKTKATTRRSPNVTAAGKLLHGYLHKTSNSLCGIKGYASLIVDGESAEGSSGRWARKILNEIERMEDIFRSVGDLNTVVSPFRSGCDLRGVLNQAVRDVGDLHAQARISIPALPEGQLLLPEADLVLVLKEILKNSAESASKIEVKISAQVEITGRVALCLQDNGPGMGPQLLKQATDPFVTTRDGHFGVGLTRVETILDMHGLAWSLTSRPGFGTTVTLEVAEALNWNPELV
jgi:signal transduction histidine kinase